MRLGGQGGCPSDRRTEHSGPRGWREAGRLGCEAGRPRVGSATSVPGGEACGVLGPGLPPGLETCLGAGGRKWGARCTRFAGWTENSVLSGRHAAPASGSDGLTLQAARRTWAIRQRRASQSSPASATRPAGPGHGTGGAPSQMPTGTSPGEPAPAARQGPSGAVRKQAMKPAPPHGGRFRTRKLDLAEPTSLREKVSRPGPGVPEPQSPWDLGGMGL